MFVSIMRFDAQGVTNESASGSNVPSVKVQNTLTWIPRQFVSNLNTIATALRVRAQLRLRCSKFDPPVAH